MKTTRRQLLAFFLIAFAWMWLLNLPRLLDAFGQITLPNVLATILGYTAVFAPGVAASVLTGLEAGKPGMKLLWQRGWDTRFSKKWLLPALLIMPAAGGLTLLILHLMGIEIPWKYGLSPTMIVPVGLLIWLLGALPEESGWRGYALPRLLETHSPLSASLLLGLIWALWHLPLHFIDTTIQFVIPFWEYALQTICLSLIYTWLHKGTQGSVFIAGLFHAMGNLTGALIPFWTHPVGRWVSFLVLLVPVLIAGFAIRVNPAANSSSGNTI